MARENDGGFGTERNLVEKILVADHTKDSSEFEFNKKTKDIALHLRNCHRLDQVAVDVRMHPTRRVTHTKILYILCKMHKEPKNLRPIISGRNGPTECS